MVVCEKVSQTRDLLSTQRVKLSNDPTVELHDCRDILHNVLERLSGTFVQQMAYNPSGFHPVSNDCDNSRANKFVWLLKTCDFLKSGIFVLMKTRGSVWRMPP